LPPFCALIAAALLHDIGHLVHDLGDNPAKHGVDDKHEELGQAWLQNWFGPEVTQPVRLHVAAKRYLCAT
jgi:predicted HD phosphohydrolase